MDNIPTDIFPTQNPADTPMFDTNLVMYSIPITTPTTTDALSTLPIPISTATTTATTTADLSAFPPPPGLSSSLSSTSSSTSSSPPPSTALPPAPATFASMLGGNRPYSYTWSSSSDYEARVYEHPSIGGLGTDDDYHGCYAQPYPIVMMTKHRGFLWNEEMFVTARRYKAALAHHHFAVGTDGRDNAAHDAGIRKEEVVEIKLEEWECDIFPA